MGTIPGSDDLIDPIDPVREKGDVMRGLRGIGDWLGLKI